MARQLIKNIGGVRQGKVVSDELLTECAIVHAQTPLPRLPRLRNHQDGRGVRAPSPPQ